MSSTRATVSADGRHIEVFVPMSFRRIGGRKLIVAPDGTAWQPKPGPAIDGNMVKMIVRAHRWRRQIEDGTYATFADVAEAEKVSLSFVSRVLRLTLLAPDIVESIIAGTQPRSLQMVRLFKPFPIEWDKQRLLFAFSQ